jgi:hypothetical protein
MLCLEEGMETLLGLVVGIGLSAACGFRVFVPLLGMSIASLMGYLSLSSGFEWIGSWPALIAFATATLFEIGAYYIPWLDHLMDTIATPAAIVAGSIVTASMIGHVSPFLKWSLAIIAGGGVAGAVQSGTVAVRGLLTSTTGGLGNFLLATTELFGSVLTTVFAILIPIVCFVLVGLLLFSILWAFRSIRQKPAR